MFSTLDTETSNRLFPGLFLRDYLLTVTMINDRLKLNRFVVYQILYEDLQGTKMMVRNLMARWQLQKTCIDFFNIKTVANKVEDQVFRRLSLKS